MSNSQSGSKRLALRFAVDSQYLLYKTEFEDGQADIANVSTGGCALRRATVPLTQNEKILIILQLEKETDPIEISARVIRVEDDFVAVQFLSCIKGTKQRIVKYFASKQRSAT